MPQFIITALGSYGDVHPMIGVGAALAERGHRVKLVTNPYFEDAVAEAGLELLPIGTRDQYAKLSQHPQIWHRVRGPLLVIKWVSGYLLRPLFEIVSDHYVPGETVLCAHPLDLASRVASEEFHAPIASLDNTPAVLWSVYDSPRGVGTLVGGPRVPLWLKRWQFRAADVVVGRMAGRPLAELRRELGLPPVERLFRRWLHDTDLVLGLFPDWFAPPQPDWPAHTQLVGFPLWDSAGGAELPGDVREFLAAGDRPIVFTPGTAHHAAHEFFATAVEACRRLGRRGILLTKFDHHVPPRLPDAVRWFGFVPLSALLPHTAAFVHHGGIGSCAQGLAAGVPQLVQPMAFDQFDNARRLVGLGVAEELSVRRFRPPALAATLERLLASSAVRTRCRELADRCDGPSARSAACDALERLAASRTEWNGN
jgi:rhamnosyltransferase subunit B